MYHRQLHYIKRNNNNNNTFNIMTEYGPWVLQWYWSYIGKYFERNATNFCGHRNDTDFVVWVTDEIQAVRERLSCVKLVKSRYVTLSIATQFVKILPGFNTSIKLIIMLTNTHHYYLPELLLSFPYYSIQFSKFHFIMNLPSLSRSPTYFLLMLTVLKQNRHEMNNTAMCFV